MSSSKSEGAVEVGNPAPPTSASFTGGAPAPCLSLAGAAPRLVPPSPHGCPTRTDAARPDGSNLVGTVEFQFHNETYCQNGTTKQCCHGFFKCACPWCNICEIC